MTDETNADVSASGDKASEAREWVIEQVSANMGLPIEQITDDTVIGHAVFTLAIQASFSLGVTLFMKFTPTTTVGDFITVIIAALDQ
ncbi:hypothetical protein HOI83_00165 [Candidatus Uhrbacteria bacterium]|jgi:hypothetical protein|nr:hypothetical protein [Candidatus Uhrbacteria bacterium]